MRPKTALDPMRQIVQFYAASWAEMGSTLYHGQTKFSVYRKTRQRLNSIRNKTNIITSRRLRRWRVGRRRQQIRILYFSPRAMLRILQKSVMVESLSFLPLITAAAATAMPVATAAPAVARNTTIANNNSFFHRRRRGRGRI
jgi:hypothetical protein